MSKLACEHRLKRQAAAAASKPMANVRPTVPASENVVDNPLKVRIVLRLQKPTDELGRSYVSFMRVSLDQIRQKVADELYTLNLFEASYPLRPLLYYLPSSLN